MGLGVQGLGKKGDDMIQVLYKDMQGRVYGLYYRTLRDPKYLIYGEFWYWCLLYITSLQDSCINQQYTCVLKATV